MQEGFFERYFEPEKEDIENTVLLGRMNPPGQHNVDIIEYADEKYEPDNCYVFLCETDQRTGSNPMTADERIEALEYSFEDTDLEDRMDLNTVDVDVFGNFWDEVGSTVSGPTAYHTGDLYQALLAEVANRGCQDISVDYEPRDQRQFLEEGPNSGSEIRELMSEGGDWRPYVATGTEYVVKENPEILDAVNTGTTSSMIRDVELVI